MIYAVMNGQYGWLVLAVDDGVATVAANTGANAALAASIRDWLTHSDRICDLIDRHGYVDVPLDQIGLA